MRCKAKRTHGEGVGGAGDLHRLHGYRFKGVEHFTEDTEKSGGHEDVVLCNSRVRRGVRGTGPTAYSTGVRAFCEGDTHWGLSPELGWLDPHPSETRVRPGTKPCATVVTLRVWGRVRRKRKL